MREYCLKLKIQNNLILEKIKELGFISINKFCKTHNLSQTLVGNILNFRTSPLFLKTGKFKPIIYKLSDILNVEIHNLFTEKQLELTKVKPKEVLIDEDQFIKLTKQSQTSDDILQLEHKIDNETIVNKIFNSNCLTDREKKLLELRFLEENSLEETSKKLNLSKGRIMQIEAKCMRKLRHPQRMKENGLI